MRQSQWGEWPSAWPRSTPAQLLAENIDPLPVDQLEPEHIEWFLTKQTS
jgi:hypothetical protein